MVRMAVTTAAESYERMQAPLADRDIEACHVDPTERLIPLTGEHVPWDPDDFDVGYIYPYRSMEGAILDTCCQVPWVNGPDDVLRSRNKGGVLATLADAGLPVPETVLVSNPVDDDTLVDAYDRIENPVVVKPNSATRGAGVARADDLDSFLGIVDYLSLVHDFRTTADKAFLVQEFVPDARDLRVMVIDGTYAGAVERRLPDESRAAGLWKHNVHRGATAVGVTPSDRIRSLAEEVASVLDISVLGVDFLIGEDVVLISETNARPTIDRAEKYETGFFDRLAAVIHETATPR